jgi:(2Fe-2S) ferredoxin
MWYPSKIYYENVEKKDAENINVERKDVEKINVEGKVVERKKIEKEKCRSCKMPKLLRCRY